MLAIASVFLLSCVSTMGCVGCTSESSLITSPWHLKPQESFGLVIVEIEMTPSLCEWQDEPSKVCHIKDMSMPKKVVKSVGSSVVVGHNKSESKTYILTAAHVCHEKQTIAVTAKSPEGKIANVLIKKKVSKILVSDYFGKEREANLYRLDVPNDLCLITTQDIWGNPFKVSPRDPVVGEKTYNVAAPHRIWSAGMVLMMDGYYSGKSSSNMYHYTIPARPGSSGSPILNREGKIVGVVQRAVMNFENLAISTSTQAIREIISTIPKETEVNVPLHTKLEVFTL